MPINVADKYALDMTGQTDSSDNLAKLAADIAAIYAAKKPLPRLVFPEGIVAFNSWPNLAYKNIQIVAEGECHLRHTGAGDAVTFSMGNLSVPKEQGENNVTFIGFIIEPTTTGDGLVINACHRSRFDVTVLGPHTASLPTNNYAGVRANFLVCTEIRSRVNAMGIGLAMDAWPSRPDLPPTICTIPQPMLEGCNYGLYMRNAAQSRVYGGTIEGCTIGVQIDNGGNNHFYGIDMEGNTTYDAVTQSKAHDNKFFYCGEGHPSKFKSDFAGWNNMLIHDLADGLFGL